MRWLSAWLRLVGNSAIVAEADMPVSTLRRLSHGVCVCGMATLEKKPRENQHSSARVDPTGDGAKGQNDDRCHPCDRAAWLWLRSRNAAVWRSARLCRAASGTATGRGKLSRP